MVISDQVVNALAVLRSLAIEHGGELKRAVDTLDNGGVFEEIDGSTGYDVTPENFAAREGTGAAPSKCRWLTEKGGVVFICSLDSGHSTSLCYDQGENRYFIPSVSISDK